MTCPRCGCADPIVFGHQCDPRHPEVRGRMYATGTSFTLRIHFNAAPADTATSWDWAEPGYTHPLP